MSNLCSTLPSTATLPKIYKRTHIKISIMPCSYTEASVEHVREIHKYLYSQRYI